MNKTYKGYELIEAIANNEIKEGTEFIEYNKKNNTEITKSIYVDKKLKHKEEGYYYDTFWHLANANFKVIEDEEKIDIQSIEELKEFKFDEFVNMLNIERFNKTMVEYSKINKILQWAKQIDKKINTKYCCNCGAELTEENTALPNMCKECKYGIN